MLTHRQALDCQHWRVFWVAQQIIRTAPFCRPLYLCPTHCLFAGHMAVVSITAGMQHALWDPRQVISDC